MSYKSNSLNAVEEKIILARDDKDRLYEPKPNKKAIRILTVAGYVLFVSLAAIMLSLYYVFIWDPVKTNTHTKVNINCDKKYAIPENLAIRQAANLTQVSPDEFLKMFLKYKGPKGESLISAPTAINNKNPLEIPIQAIPKEFIESKTKFLKSTQQPLPPMEPQRDDYFDDTLDYENESSGQKELSDLQLMSNSTTGPDDILSGNDV